MRRAAAGRPGDVRDAAVADCSERVDQHQPGHPARLGQCQVHRQVPAPRVAEDNGAARPARVEHCHRVSDVLLYGEGPVDRRRAQAALLVTHGAPAGHLGTEHRHVIGEAGAAMQQQERRALPALQAGDRAGAGTRLEWGGSHAGQFSAALTRH